MPSGCNAVMGFLVSTRRASTQAVICCVSASRRRTTMPSNHCLAAKRLGYSLILRYEADSTLVQSYMGKPGPGQESGRAQSAPRNFGSVVPFNLIDSCKYAEARCRLVLYAG